MRAPWTSATLVALLLTAPLTGRGAARADDYFGGGGTDNVTFRIDKTRSRNQKIVIGSLFGGAVLASGVGLLFTIDSKSKSDAVSAVGAHTGEIYTPEIDDTRRRALRSRDLALLSYGIGGALLAATAVTYVVTDPGTEVIDLEEYQRRHDERRKARSGRTTVAPVPGGALVGKTWTF